MQHNLIDLLKISQRVLCCLVALLLVLSLALMPVKVNAAQVLKKEIPIGVFGGPTVSVSAGEAVAGLLLATCVTGVASNWDNFVARAKYIYANVSSSVRSWFDSVGSKAGTDTEYITIVIPPNVVKEFNDKNGQEKKLPEGIPFVGPFSYSQFTQLDTATEDTVFSPDIATLIAKGVSILDALSLGLDSFRLYFGQTMIDTRVALNNSFINKIDSLYEQLHLFSTNITSELVGTRTTLNNTLNNIATPIYNAINGASRNVATQVIDMKTALVSPLSGIKTAIDNIAADVDSLTGSKDDTDDQIAVVPPFSVPNLKSKLTSIADGFKRLFQRPDEDDDNPSIPWLPFNLFSKDDGSNGFFLSMFDDSEFINTLKGFYDFVASLWLLFPLAIRYFITFGFGTPIVVGLAKMFAG